ncbi:universal stress protein [Halocola ammonii]
MKKLEHIALLCDLSEMDEIMLSYLEKLDTKQDFQSLTLVHFVEVDELTEEIKALIPDSDKSIEKIIEEELRETCDRIFQRKHDQVNIHVHQGGNVDDLSEWVDSQNFDALVVGKKSSYHGSGIFASQLVRLTTTSIMIIPESARSDIRKIVLPIDFSKYTRAVLEIGSILGKSSDSHLLPIHIIRLSPHYFPLLKEDDSIKKEMEKSAIKKYEKEANRLNISAPLNIAHETDQHTSKVIYRYAMKENADLIIVGKKGRHHSEELLIGGVTEQLISSDKHIPVLIMHS